MKKASDKAHCFLDLGRDFRICPVINHSFELFGKVISTIAAWGPGFIKFS